MYETHAIKVSSVDSPEEWLEARYEGIGASEAPVLLGEGYGSRYRLWREKRREISPVDLSDVEAVQWGIETEALIAKVFSRRSGLGVHPSGVLYRSRTYPWAMCTPDYLTESGVPVEVKNLNAWAKIPQAINRDGYSNPEEWPERIRLQVQWQMLVTGALHAYSVALVGGQRLAWTYYDRDESTIRELTAEGEEFWARVMTNSPPPMEGGDDELDAIDAFWGPDREETEQEPIPELEEWVLNLALQEIALKQEGDSSEEARKAILNQIREEMGTLRKANVGPFTYYFTHSTPRLSFKPVRPVAADDAEDGDVVECVVTKSYPKDSLRRSGKA